MKFSLGLFGLTEAGVKLPDLFDRPAEEDWKSLTRGHAKVAFSSPGEALWWIPSGAAGAENSPDRESETYYTSWLWRGTVSEWPLELLVGYGSGRFQDNPFYGMTLMPYTYLGHSIKFLAEYSGHKADAGVRFALSRTLRLDFALLMDVIPLENERYSIKIDRAILGASQTGQIRPERVWRALFRKRTPKPPSGAPE